MSTTKQNVYLAGAMESAENLGAGWRKELTPFLENLNFNVLDPCEFEPHQLKGLQPNRLPDYYTDGLSGNKIKCYHWHQLKNAEEAHLKERFLKYMRRIIEYDCDIVQTQTNLIIVLWDEAAGKGAGTHSELTLGYLNNIPILCVATTDMPAWAKACCSNIFLDFDSLKEFIENNYIVK